MSLIGNAKHFAKKILGKTSPASPTKEEKIQGYLNSERIAWSDGYDEYKWDFITQAIADPAMLEVFRKRQLLPTRYGYRLDDRSVEYPWIFANMLGNANRFLDAGSTFNFPSIITHPLLTGKEITILTYYPEYYQFVEKRISYVFADLREIPIRDNWFDEIVCQSTLEHVDMDNSIYGYQKTEGQEPISANYSYRSVIKELIRILKPGGQLLLTCPYGKFENHGFFQQFSQEMVEDMRSIFLSNGQVTTDFFIYKPDGWYWSDIDEASEAKSYNPHTGIGKGNDGAAHSRAICCIKFYKAG